MDLVVNGINKQLKRMKLIKELNLQFFNRMFKSGFRIIAALYLINQEFTAAGTLFIIAELLGILEEL